MVAGVVDGCLFVHLFLLTHFLTVPHQHLFLDSPGTMMGYYKNEEATKETITADGFLKTGDRGEMDAQGRLKITGRTKELFKTSKGKYVAPAPIENKLINHPLVELACVGGASYPQPHAVVQLSEDAKENAKDARKACRYGTDSYGPSCCRQCNVGWTRTVGLYCHCRRRVVAGEWILDADSKDCSSQD